MTQTILLKGCSPTPLAHYLKALGILRLVAEQKDPEATGCWRNEGFVLNSSLDEQALQQFFLEEYRPTPILTPWNGRGGFLEGDDEEAENDENQPSGRKGAQMVSLFSGNVHERFTPIKNALLQIAANKTLSSLNSYRTKWKAQKALIDKKKKSKQSVSDEEKEELKFLEIQIKTIKRNLLQSLRNELNGPMLEWFDACQIVSDKLLHAPLLGAGGLDGSMDFGVNYLERLSCVFNIGKAESEKESTVREWGDALLKETLFGLNTPLIPQWIPGQFAPGNVGGPNSTTGFSGNSQDNHWSYILTLEGSLLLATAATRRLQNDSMGALSYPFTVKTAGSGSGSSSGIDADSKKSRAEIWLPLWYKPATLEELKVLFQEGRATVGRRPAKDGLDFARAVAALGVDRGIGEFQRYGFMMRSGKAYLATPLGRIQTCSNPTADLIQELDKTRFLDNLRSFTRKAEAPGRIVSLVHQLENRLFELTRSSNPKTVQDILILLGKLQRTLSISAKGREAVRRPVPLLSAPWLLNADDGSAEFRLACALSGLSAADLPMRVHFAPVKAKEQAWDEHSRLAVWGEGSFENNMTTLLRTRLLAAERQQHKDKPFGFSFGADCSDIAAFLELATDDRRIGELAQGLALINNIPRHPAGQNERKPQSVLPGAYVILKPFFTTDEILQKTGFLPPDCKLSFRPEILAWLAADQTGKAVKLAWDKLRQAGVALPAYPNQPPCALGVNGQRLLAALAIPIEFGQLAKMLRNIKRQQKQNN